jgi:hypothetical protein
MQIATHYQQVFFGFNNRTLESALKQMPDHLMPMIKVDRVRGVCGVRRSEPQKDKFLIRVVSGQQTPPF